MFVTAIYVIMAKSIALMGFYALNQNLECFVFYIEIINTFLKKKCIV